MGDREFWENNLKAERLALWDSIYQENPYLMAKGNYNWPRRLNLIR